MAFITATTALIPGAAMASTSGSRELDVLGYDAEDRKVYFLEHFHDESGEVPRLSFMHVAGPHAGKMIPVESWYRDDADAVEAKFPGRLAQLEGRLMRLVPEPQGTYALSTRITQRRAQRIYPEDPPVRKYTLQLTVAPHRDAHEIASLYAPSRATVTAYFRPKATLTEVARIPGMDVSVALVSYLGIPYEVGYERDVAVLIRP